MQRTTLINGIILTNQVIDYYTKLRPLTTDGNFIRSIDRVLDESAYNKEMLEKQLKKLVIEERKIKGLDAYTI